MARPQKNQVAQQQLATNIQRLRSTKPNATLKDIERWGWSRGLDVGRQTINTAMRGEADPTACTVEVLLLLASFFEVAPAELGTYAEERINAVLSFANAGTPDGGTPVDQGIPLSRCTGLIPLRTLSPVPPIPLDDELDEAA